MDTKKYEVLEKTVELSSLTKAAQELGLTQSGVSHMLAAAAQAHTDRRAAHARGRADDALHP